MCSHRSGIDFSGGALDQMINWYPTTEDAPGDDDGHLDDEYNSSLFLPSLFPLYRHAVREIVAHFEGFIGSLSQHAHLCVVLVQVLWCKFR